MISVLLVGVVLTLVLLAAGCTKKTGGSTSNAKEVVATVNGQIITRGDLDTRIADLKAYYGSQGLDFSSVPAEMLAMLEEDALEQLIQEALIAQAAKDMGLVVDEKEINDQLALMKASMSKEQYEASLKSQNLTEERLLERMRFAFLADKLYRQITDQVEVTPAEIRQYFDANKDSLIQIRVSHILFEAREDTATPAERAAAKAKAEEAIKKLKTGADFAQMAVEMSGDPASKDQGGLIDYYFTKDDPTFVAEFTQGAFELKKVGDFSQTPVETFFGYHIIKLDDRRDSFEEMTDQIKARLENEKRNDVFGDFYEELEGKAQIENKLRK